MNPEQGLAKGIIGTRGLENQAAGALSASQYNACRENAQTIVRNQMAIHEREATAWRWLDAAMHVHKPTDAEEAALWDLLCRARRETRF